MAKTGPDRSGRRRFVLQSMAAVGAAGAIVRTSRATVPLGATEHEVPADASKVQGYPLADESYGTRSQFETEVRRRFKTPTAQSSWTMTPLAQGVGIITPSGLHFERSHAGTAIIDPERHRLYVHGMVDEPRKYTMRDLKRFPSISRLMFLECSGNGLTEWSKPTMPSVQFTHGLTSTSEWTGVPLATILHEAGLRRGARWLLAEGGDAAMMTRSIPLEKALRDCFLAYGQNGEALRPEQGYPLRLIVPGWQGNVNIKWLRRIQIGDQPWYSREETSKYTELMEDGKIRGFTWLIYAKSVITFPCPEKPVKGPGLYEIRGFAWSGKGRITQVDVSTDGGVNWQRARLQEPVLSKALTRFTHEWRWDGKPALLQSRAVDETGFVQPTIAELRAARGVNGIYNNNSIQTWQVKPDGSVFDVQLA